MEQRTKTILTIIGAIAFGALVTILSAVAAHGCAQPNTVTTPVVQSRKQLANAGSAVQLIEPDTYENFTGYQGLLTQSIIEDEEPNLQINGGTSAGDNGPYVFVPVSGELVEANSSGDLTLGRLTWARCYNTSLTSSWFMSIFEDSPIGGIYIMNPTGRYYVVGATGITPDMTNDYSGEILSRSYSTTTIQGRRTIYQFQITGQDVQHYNYLYLRADNGLFTDLTPLFLQIKATQDERYSEGAQDGYEQGYTTGRADGYAYALATGGSEETTNVFSLFTSAFNVVGGFMNLKVFGFLPLYWFFLVPLFVTIVALLLRLVKH